MYAKKSAPGAEVPPQHREFFLSALSHYAGRLIESITLTLGAG